MHYHKTHDTTYKEKGSITELRFTNIKYISQIQICFKVNTIHTK